jgi:hypothetical protein
MLFEFVQSTAINVTVQPTSVDRTVGEESGEELAVQPAAIRNSEKPSENYSPRPAFAQNENRSVSRSSAESDRPTGPVPFPTELKPEDALIESIERLVADELPHLHDVPSQTLCRQIVDGLKGAPLEHMQALIRRKMKKIAELGLLRDLAQQVGRAWLREAGARQRATDARAAHDASVIEQGRVFAQKTLDDPRAGPEEKELARELLGNERSKKAGGRG